MDPRTHTVWAHDALPLVQNRYKPIYRVMLPIVDFLAILFSVAAVIIGSRAVAETTTPTFELLWAAVIGGSALAAFIGLVFMLDWVEIIAKLFLCVSFAVYIWLLILSIDLGTFSTILTIVVTVGFLLTPLFRIFDLVGEIAKNGGR